MTNEYISRGDYHKNLNKNWAYYSIYLAKKKFITSYLKDGFSNAKILDAGAGEGVFVDELREKGLDIEGLDLNFSSPSVKRGSILEMPFEAESFNAVLCLDVLEHLSFSDQEKAVKELKRVVKTGGTIIISVPNLAHLWSRIRFLFLGRLSRTANIKKHIGDRPFDEYKKILEKEGLKIIRIKGIFPTVPVLAQLIFRRPSTFLWLHKLLNLTLPIKSISFLDIFICKK